MRLPGPTMSALSERRRAWLVAAVAVGVVVIFMVLGLSRCGSREANLSAPSSRSASAEASSTGQAQILGGGRLTAGDTVLVPRSAGTSGNDLSPYVGRRAEGSHISVLSAPADAGFWVGTSPLDRTWVQLSGTPSRHVQAGQTVSFTGTVVAHGDDFPDQVGVSALEGSSQLASERAHIQVAAGALTTD